MSIYNAHQCSLWMVIVHTQCTIHSVFIMLANYNNEGVDKVPSRWWRYLNTHNTIAEQYNKVYS